MNITPHLERVGRVAARAGRALAAGFVLVLRSVWAGLVRAWRGPLRRRLAGPTVVLARVAVLAAIVAAGTISFLDAAVVTVTPSDIAVVQRNWGAQPGVVPEDIGAGKILALPGRDSVYVLSARTHYLRFGMESEGNEFPSLELLSGDGLEVRMAVTVPFRITAGEAHQIVAEGRRSTYRVAARATAERVLLQEFARLDKDGWIDAEGRRAAEIAALAEIADAFAPFHLTPLGVHVTAAWFPPMYEVELQEQKLLEQRILTDEMLSSLDERQHALLVEREDQARTETELSAGYAFRMEEARIELEAGVLAVQSEAKQYEFERGTEADNLYQKAVADGLLAVELAEALRERLVNGALETDGGRLLLARDAARNLRFKSVSLDANNPDVPSILDLDALSRLLIGE